MEPDENAPELDESPAIQDDEQPVAEHDNQAAPDDGEEGEQPGTEEPQEPEDDSEEFEWEGKKFKGPKGLKDGVLRHSDYTQKTQIVAAERQQVQQRHQALNEWYQQADNELDIRSDLKKYAAEIERYSSASEQEWLELEQRDPMGAQAEFRRFQKAKDNYEQTAQLFKEMQSQRSERTRSELAERVQETRDYAQKNIKGWTPQVDEQLETFTKNELGLDLGLISQHLSGPVYKALHLAWLGYQATQKPSVKPTPAKIETLKTVSGKSNPPVRKSYAEMSMEEYAKARGFK